jgi:hypothetical protein
MGSTGVVLAPFIDPYQGPSLSSHGGSKAVPGRELMEDTAECDKRVHEFKKQQLNFSALVDQSTEIPLAARDQIFRMRNGPDKDIPRTMGDSREDRELARWEAASNRVRVRSILSIRPACFGVAEAAGKRRAIGYTRISPSTASNRTNMRVDG